MGDTGTEQTLRARLAAALVMVGSVLLAGGRGDRRVAPAAEGWPTLYPTSSAPRPTRRPRLHHPRLSRGAILTDLDVGISANDAAGRSRSCSPTARCGRFDALHVDPVRRVLRPRGSVTSPSTTRRPTRRRTPRAAVPRHRAGPSRRNRFLTYAPSGTPVRGTSGPTRRCSRPIVFTATLTWSDCDEDNDFARATGTDDNCVGLHNPDQRDLDRDRSG